MLIVPQNNTTCLVNLNSVKKIDIFKFSDFEELYSVRVHYGDEDLEGWFDNLYPSKVVAEKVLSAFKKIYLNKTNSIFYFPSKDIKEEEL